MQVESVHLVCGWTPELAIIDNLVKLFLPDTLKFLLVGQLAPVERLLGVMVWDARRQRLPPVIIDKLLLTLLVGQLSCQS